jgi:predicted negative regulator of RcsB-dependent stress response
MSESNTSTPISGTSLADIEKAQPAVEQFLDKHQIKLIALILLLIVAALAYVVQRELEQGKEETAGALLVSKSEAADLEGIVKNYQGTAAAGSSKILLAEKQWQDGKEDDAIATLTALADSAEAHPARPSGLASLAAKLLKQGKTADAEKFLTEITEDTNAGYLAAYAWITLGDIAVKKGDLEAAEKAYSTVEKDYSENFQAAQEAITRRLLMKATSPVEIAAPTPPLDSKIIDTYKDATETGEIKNVFDALKATGQDVPIIPLPKENGGNE